jgi:predicted DNA-binding transcriptional regulator YafY
MPAPLKQQIQKTLDWMQKLPKDDKYLRIIAALADAWVNRSQVKISYQALEAQERSERVIEPYFIEPAAAGHASYVIAYCHRSKGVRTFKIERIESINILNETFDIPPNFDANNYLGHSLGIGVGEKVRTIKLKFAPELSRLMEETIWHPSQKLERQTDNSAIMTLQVFDTPELKSWILGWGDKVEVLGPQKLRREIITSSSRTLSLYSRSVG